MPSASAPRPSPAALYRVPGVAPGTPPLRIERLLGGSVNESWRVDTALGRFVLRVDGPLWRRPGVNRARERLLHGAAADAGLAPRLLWPADAAGIQLCEFLDGRSWDAADFLQPGQIDRLGARLAQLHTVQVPSGVSPFDPVDCAREYLRIIEAQGTEAGDAASLVAEIDKTARQVAQGSGAQSIVHGDLAHSNLLDGTALWLLDWEYAQLSDPIYDVACALAYYPEARALSARLLAAAGLNGRDQTSRLGAAIRVYEALSALWQQARLATRPR